MLRSQNDGIESLTLGDDLAELMLLLHETQASSYSSSPVIELFAAMHDSTYSEDGKLILLNWFCIHQGVDINTVNRHETVLSIAIELNSIRLVRAAIDLGAAVNFKSSLLTDGTFNVRLVKTIGAYVLQPLEVALAKMQSNSPAIVKALIEAGAKIDKSSARYYPHRHEEVDIYIETFLLIIKHHKQLKLDLTDILSDHSDFVSLKPGVKNLTIISELIRQGADLFYISEACKLTQTSSCTHLIRHYVHDKNHTADFFKLFEQIEPLSKRLAIMTGVSRTCEFIYNGPGYYRHSEKIMAFNLMIKEYIRIAKLMPGIARTMYQIKRLHAAWKQMPRDLMELIAIHAIGPNNTNDRALTRQLFNTFYAHPLAYSDRVSAHPIMISPSHPIKLPDGCSPLPLAISSAHPVKLPDRCSRLSLSKLTSVSLFNRHSEKPEYIERIAIFRRK